MFTEILTVLVVCCVLISVLLPALGGARGSSFSDVSLNNLKNIHTALTTYGGDFNDRQPTWVVDNFSTYGQTAEEAVIQYYSLNGTPHPGIAVGECNDQLWGYWFDLAGFSAYILHPIKFTSGVGNGFGTMRLTNAQIIHSYVGGKFQSPEFFAPADRAIYPLVEPLMEHPCSYYEAQYPQWSSYLFSGAAMYNPGVLRKPSQGGYINPYSFSTGFKSPSVSQATFPNLKTRLMEHHWLQDGPDSPCNPGGTSSYGAGCWPNLFNSGLASKPATLFFDGSARLFPNTEAIQSDQLVLQQSGGVDGLWHRGTPFGANGYFSQFALDDITTSHHVLTTQGINGRDTLGPN